MDQQELLLHRTDSVMHRGAAGFFSAKRRGHSSLGIL
jgi:hypothetical protein